MANDGSISFVVDIDAKDAAKELNKLKRKIEESEGNIASMEKAKSPLVEQAQRLQKSMQQARADVERFQQQWVAGVAGADQAQASAQARVAQLEKEYQGVVAQIDKIDDKLMPAYEKLDRMKDSAGELEKQLAASESAAGKMGAAVEGAQKSAEKFKNRIKEVVRSALIFTVITRALSKLRDWIGAVINANEEARQSMAQLKGALLTLAQPLVSVVIPAFVQLVRVLTALVGRLASLTASLFGTTAAQASKAAQALNAEMEALEGTGDAAKKASQSLAGFDEINTLGSGTEQSSNTMTAPDFSWSVGINERLQQIADAVLLIGIGFGLWRLSDKLPDKLGAIASKLGGIAITAGGLLLAWNGFSDAMENGVDWDNLISMLGGTAAAAAGLFLVFGQKGAAVGLLVGSIGLLISGFKDMTENGANLKNMLASIAGLIGTGLGIGVLVGSIIPAVIAGIAAIVLAIAGLTGNADQLIGNLKDIFGGLADFIKGVINLDIVAAFDGLKRAGKGVVNGLLTIFGSFINLMIRGINWLISQINKIRLDVPNWVPRIGGKTLGFNLKQQPEWKIPQLATGAVIPPNREFLAVLGDQRSGNNIEAPEALIRQIVREEAGGMNTELLREILQAVREAGVLVVDGEKLTRRVVRHINNMTLAAGESVLVL